MSTIESTDKEIPTVLSAFFEHLDKVGLKYCVVGRSEELPFKISGDIDFVVDLDSLSAIHKCIFDFSRENALDVVQILQHEQTAYFFTLTWTDKDNTHRHIYLDICGDYFRNGRIFLTASNILLMRRQAIDEAGREKGFFIAEASKEFIYYLLKKIDKQVLDEEQGNHLSSIWEKAPDECNKEIERFWPNGNAKVLRQAARDGQWDEVRENLPALKKCLHSTLPSNSIKSWAAEFVRLIRRVLHPTGLHVVFLGPDGSGKTSVIDRGIQELAPAFRKTVYSHLRPCLGIKKRNGKPVVDPHAQSPRSLITSVAKVFYLWVDYFLGWWMTVWPKMVCSTLVVYDRYYHDLLIDPIRYRYGGPMWLARMIGWLIPKPDLWILLDAPPEVLQERKQEVSFEETARQQKEYLKLVRGMKNGIVVDASKSLDEVVANVNAIILDYMAKRTEERYG